MSDSTINITGMIELLPDEQTAFGEIDFDQDKIFANRELYLRNAYLVSFLAKKLIDRGAIPIVRLKYLDDSEYQSGGRKHSIVDRFVANGTKTDQEIFEHPSFLKHFRYLILGADLPAAAKQQFKHEIERRHVVNGTDALDLGRIGRGLAENFQLDYPKAPEEFYKLALDCGVFVGHALTIRDRMKTLKPRKNRRL